jgi:hypothetical protein
VARVIRDYRPEDEPALRALHERLNNGWPFPDLSSPLYIAKKVVEIDGQIKDVAYLRATATTQMYLGSPSCKEEESATMHELQTELLNIAWVAGLQEIYMTLQSGPEHDYYSDRLKAFGWKLVPNEPLYEHLTGDSPSLKAVA